jgi:hypothetical protein
MYTIYSIRGVGVLINSIASTVWSMMKPSRTSANGPSHSLIVFLHFEKLVEIPIIKKIFIANVLALMAEKRLITI